MREEWTRSLNRRRRKAALRLRQSQSHLLLVEHRLKDLESNVRKLLKLPEVDDSDAALAAVPKHKLEIRWLNWLEFSARNEINVTDKIWTHRPEIDLDPQNVIEVLVEEPSFILTRLAPRYGGNNSTSTAIVSHASAASIQESGFLIYRIRIRSSL